MLPEVKITYAASLGGDGGFRERGIGMPLRLPLQHGDVVRGGDGRVGGCDDQMRGRVAEQRFEPPGGRGRVERHVEAAAFEDGEHSGHERGGAVEHQRHRAAGPDAEFGEPAGKPVRPRLERGIGDLLVAIDQRDAGPVLPGDVSEQRRDRSVARIGRACAARKGRERRRLRRIGGGCEPRDRPFAGGSGHGVRDAAEFGGVALDRRRIEQVGVVLEEEEDLALCLHRAQRQVEFADLVHPGDGLEHNPAVARALGRDKVLGGVGVDARHPALEAEAHTGQRVGGRVRGPQPADHRREGRLRMAERGKQRLVDVARQRARRCCRIEPYPQEDEVCEVADDTLEARSGPAVRGGGHDEIVLPAQPVQEDKICRAEHRIEVDLPRRRQRPQRLRLPRVQLSIEDGPAERRTGGPRPVGREFRRGGQAGEGALPEGKVGGLFRSAAAGVLPGGEGGVVRSRRRRHRAFRRLADPERLVGAGEIAEEDRQRQPVERDVVEGEEEGMVLFAEAQEVEPRRRSDVEREGAGAERHEPRGQRLAVQRGRVMHGGGGGTCLDPLLNGAFAGLLEAQAERCVARDDRVPRAEHGFNVERPADAEAAREIVGVVVRRQLPCEPQRLLAGGQRDPLAGRLWRGGRRRGATVADPGFERLQRGLLEQFERADAAAFLLLQPGEDLDADEGIETVGAKVALRVDLLRRHLE